MSGDVHVRFYERPWGRFPRATHPALVFTERYDAERVLRALPKRFAKYGLAVHEEKTVMLRFVPPEGIRSTSGEFPVSGIHPLLGTLAQGEMDREAEDRERPA